jgi:tricorn protease
MVLSTSVANTFNIQAMHPNTLKHVETCCRRAQEWANILAETYKFYADLFYAANMHGVDWPAQYQKYAAYLPHCAHRVDVTGLQCDMVAELSTGHTARGLRCQSALPFAVG